ncbi:MAG: carboxylating nicotinate-nucleotide diphosphorylase [bacterium]|nr:carboxylating nicotinate-nucleotide diphosphorylase [bacterium]
MQLKPLSRFCYESIVRETLREDLGRGFDLTTDAIIPPTARCTARIISRAEGVLAGVEVANSVFSFLSSEITVSAENMDGASIGSGETISRIEGPAHAVLSGERTALNLLGHLSGVASLTQRFVEQVAETQAKVVCTRKTTPMLRVLEKYAVRCGGGMNHRFGLDDGVLIKENHIAVAGGISKALELARASVGHTVLIEVEVEELSQLEEAVTGGADAVLLDNMDSITLRRGVELVEGRVVTEASGGITLANVAEVAETGVDLISVGALTHSAPALDLSLLAEDLS